MKPGNPQSCPTRRRVGIRRLGRHFPVTAIGLAASAACLAAGPAPAQSPAPESLDPVVVVATREARPVTEVAGDVTVITRDDLELSLATSLADAFRYTPGIDAARSGTRFGTDGLILRGLGGNRVAIELDGVPLSRQFAIGSFSSATRDLVDVGQVQRVEVLHGPASALYGSAALGGVVAIRTPEPLELLPPGRDLAVGLSQGFRAADDSRHTRGFLAGAGDRLGGLLAGTWRQGHEPGASAAAATDPQDVESASALAKLAWEDAAGNRLTGLAYGYREDVQTEVHSVLGSGRFANTTELSGDDESRIGLFALSYALAGGGWLDGGELQAWTGSTAVAQDTVDERAAAPRPVRIERRFEYDESLYGLSADLYRAVDLAGRAHRLGFGAQWTHGRIEELRDARETGLEDGSVSATVLGEDFPLRDFPTSATDEFGLYVQDEIAVGRATLIAALRYDRYRLDPDPDLVYGEDNPATTPVSIDRDEFSPKLGVVVPISDHLDGWVQYAHGFRAPSFEDANIGLDIPLFNIRAIPNPDLQPETSDGIEAGLRWRGAAAAVDLAAYYTRYDEFIESKVPLGPDPDSGRLLFQSQNISEAHIWGAELEARVALGAGFDLRGAASWARGENADDDQPLNSVGPPQAVLGVGWTRGDTELALLATFARRHSRLDESAGELFEAPGYGVLDLFAAQRLGERLVLRAALENLTDKTWWRWADVQGLAPDDPFIPPLSRPGRSVAVELGWNF